MMIKKSSFHSGDIVHAYINRGSDRDGPYNQFEEGLVIEVREGKILVELHDSTRQWVEDHPARIRLIKRTRSADA